MELNHLDHHSSSSVEDAPSFRLSMVLYAFSWLFFIFQSWSADIIWTWIWRGLSAISLILIIYINWNKALDIFQNKKKKSKYLK